MDTFSGPTAVHFREVSLCIINKQNKRRRAFPEESAGMGTSKTNVILNLLHKGYIYIYIHICDPVIIPV